ncbi:MAG: hypothetical protein ABIX10_11190 [Acidimicrobiales bacterium]
MPGIGGTIAHAATPWEWQSRMSVIVLVIAMSALTVAMVVDGWLSDGTNPIAATIWSGGIGTVLLVWPAFRSLRRWDEAHRTEAGHPIPPV